MWWMVFCVCVNPLCNLSASVKIYKSIRKSDKGENTTALEQMIISVRCNCHVSVIPEAQFFFLCFQIDQTWKVKK